MKEGRDGKRRKSRHPRRSHGVVVDNKAIVELKAVERLMPFHEAQMLTYLKLSPIKTGLLMNFNSATLKEGLRRFVL